MATGRSKRSAKASTVFCTSALQPGPPTIISGRDALASLSASAAMSAAAGLDAATRAGLASTASHSAASMSSGRPSTTGPGRPERAAWKAWLTYSGMRSVWRMTAAHFTNEENSRFTSISWNASRSSVSRAGMPTNMTSGVESCWATCSPLMALAAPGPRVTKHTPGSPVILPHASAIIDAPPSWRQMTVLMRLESCSPSRAARKLSPGTVNAVVAPCASS